jgi:hypothetical protein
VTDRAANGSPVTLQTDTAMHSPTRLRFPSRFVLAGAGLLVLGCQSLTLEEGTPLASTIVVGSPVLLDQVGRDTAEVTGTPGGLTVDGEIQVGGICYQLTPQATQVAAEIFVVVTASSNGATCEYAVYKRPYRVQVQGVAPGAYSVTVRHRIAEPTYANSAPVRNEAVVVH